MASSIFGVVDNLSDRIVTVLTATAALTGVQIEAGWPGDQIKPECIWVDTAQFESTTPVFRGPDTGAFPLVRQAALSLPLQVYANTRGQTLTVAKNRVTDIAGAAEIALAEDPTLTALDGIQDATLSVGVVSVSRMPDVGVIGYARLVLNVNIRAQ